MLHIADDVFADTLRYSMFSLLSSNYSRFKMNNLSVTAWTGMTVRNLFHSLTGPKLAENFNLTVFSYYGKDLSKSLPYRRGQINCRKIANRDGIFQNLEENSRICLILGNTTVCGPNISWRDSSTFLENGTSSLFDFFSTKSLDV